MTSPNPLSSKTKRRVILLVLVTLITLVLLLGGIAMVVLRNDGQTLQPVVAGKQSASQAPRQPARNPGVKQLPTWVPEYIAKLEEFANLVEGIYTLEALAAAEPRMSAIDAQIQTYSAELLKLSEDDQNELDRQYGKRMEAATRRIDVVTPRLERLSGRRP